MATGRLLELSLLDPEVVGEEVSGALGAQLEWAAARLARVLGPPSPEATPLARSVAAVVRWAQRGEGRPEEMALQVGDLMWAMGFSPDGEGELERVQAGREPLSATGLTLCAALARLELTSGLDPTPAGLAALAGARLGEVLGLLVEGRLGAAGDKVEHRSALAWLGLRGTPGFGAEGASSAWR